MKSIRRNLLLALLGAMCMAMLVGGLATYRVAHQEAGALFDYHLRQLALSVRDQRFQEPEEALASDENLDYVIRVWDLSGLTMYYSRPHAVLPELTQLGYSLAETDEGKWRMFAIQHHGMTIAVAQPMRVRNRLAADAAWRTLKPFFILLPVLGGLVWVLVGLGLRPLNSLAASLQKRSHDSLEALADTGVPEELRPLVAALNDLLARLKGAFDAQRDFVADAAHELRTPLTALQLQAQLVERACSDETRQQALDDLKQGLLRTAHTVQQLLTLARQEPGAGATNPVGRLELAVLAREAVIEHAKLAEARGIDLGLAEADAAAVVSGDADGLRILLANLLTNALRYTPCGGRIDVACRMLDGQPLLEVTDSGPGIPPDERERVFDRFYRRSNESETGSGLGLAIVRAIAQRHQATVSLLDAPGGGLLVRVTFLREGGREKGEATVFQVKRNLIAKGYCF